MLDKEVAKKLKRMGFDGATVWTVKYRRRKLGFKKYLYGEIQKHREWIRRQAIKKYGRKCELCDYSLVIEAHHIIPKHKGGLHEIDNLMILCPNCHVLLTRRKLILTSRKDINAIRQKLKKLRETSY